MRNLTATLWLTFAVLLGSVGVSESADFQKGMTAAQSGDYATALRELKLLAEQGNPDAQNTLGFMYEYGKDVPQNYKNAVKWYTRAAEQGNADAQENPIFLAKQGDADARSSLTSLAEQGIATAQFKLGWMYSNGNSVPQDYKAGVKWYTLAAEQGHAGAQNNLGLMYSNGKGVPQDYKTALKWWLLPPNRGMPTPGSIWAGCTSTEKVFHKIIRRRRSGTALLRNRGNDLAQQNLRLLGKK